MWNAIYTASHLANYANYCADNCMIHNNIILSKQNFVKDPVYMYILTGFYPIPFQLYCKQTESLKVVKCKSLQMSRAV